MYIIILVIKFLKLSSFLQSVFGGFISTVGLYLSPHEEANLLGNVSDFCLHGIFAC